MSKWLEETNKLKLEHTDTLQSIVDAYFVIKTPVRYKEQQCIVMYKSELSKGDVYIELVDSSLKPGIERTLYRYAFNNFWKDEYETVAGETDKYYIPIEELHIIPKRIAKAGIGIKVPTLNKTGESFLDKSMKELTIRDYIAIIHRRPVSKNKELNDFLATV